MLSLMYNSDDLSSSSDDNDDYLDDDLNEKEEKDLKGILKGLYEYHNQYPYDKLNIIIADNNDKNIINKKNYDLAINCPHKKIKCNIISPCCGKEFMCSLCHDEYYSQKSNDHKMNGKKVTRIVCLKCEEYQDISNQCTKCNIKFAEYYCDKCKVFGDTNSGYHCDKCNACLLGPKNKFSHCDGCGCCVEKRIINTHKCLPNRMCGRCTICMDSMENGESIIIMKCGHSLHEKCYRSLIENSYKCPECFKTIKDMTQEFLLLDMDISRQPMPETKIIGIKCNDCEDMHNAKFHYLGTKCKKCGSYNTYEL